MVSEPGSLSPLPPSAVNAGAGSDINEQVSPSYELRLTRNAARPYRSIPVVLGKHRVVPPFAAVTKSEIDATDGFLYQRFLLVWGYGQLKVTDVRIGNAPISDYDDIQIETREGLASDTATTLYSASDPLADAPAPLAVSAIRVRITDQLPRTVNEISGICSSVALDWNGSAWVSRETSNPASLLRHVLQHAGRREPAANADIDLAALQTFHDFCASNNYEFNAIHDTRRSVWDVVRDICAVGRSSPSVSRGKWTVVTDSGTQAITDHLTPINTSNFRRRRSFDDAPHAMLVRFANRNKGWQRDERLVYRDGYSAANATNVQTVSPTGITSPGHAWKFARYHLAVAAVQERWECDQGLENLLAQRGQRVTVQHERLGVGLGSFRVTAVNRNSANRVTSLDIDADLRINNAAATYQVKVRNADDVDTLITLRSLAVGAVRRLTFAAARTLDVVVGDLVSVGVRGSVQTQGLVTGVRRQGGLTGALLMIPWTPGVYTAESGGAPAFTSNLSDLPSPLPPLVIDSATSGRAVYELVGNVLAPRVVLAVNAIPVPGVRAEVELRETGDTAWLPAAIVTQSSTSIVVGGVLAGTTYSFRARWVVPEDDRVGAWESVTHQVTSVLPDPPRTLGVTGYADGTRVVRFSTPTVDDDIAGVEVRYGDSGDEWADMTQLHSGLLTQSPLETLDPVPGTYDFEARTCTTSGFTSATGTRDDGVTLRPQRRWVPEVDFVTTGSTAAGDQAGDYRVRPNGLVDRWDGTAWQDQGFDLTGEDGSQIFSGTLAAGATPPTNLGQRVHDVYLAADGRFWSWESDGADGHEWDYRGDLSGRDAEDGKGIEFIFRRQAAATTPTIPVTSDDDKARDDFQPTGWVDDPPSPSVTNRYVFVARRLKPTGKNQPWSEFGGAKLWALFSLDGADGSTWLSGDDAPNNNQGSEGDWYFRTGSAPNAGKIYNKGSTAWVEIVQVEGSDGSDGSVWHSGSGAPAGTLGAVGDYYFDTSNGHVSEKTAANTWTFERDITGSRIRGGSTAQPGTDRDVDWWIRELTTGIDIYNQGTVQTSIDDGTDGDDGDPGTDGFGIGNIGVSTTGGRHTITLPKVSLGTNVAGSFSVDDGTDGTDGTPGGPGPPGPPGTSAALGTGVVQTANLALSATAEVSSSVNNTTRSLSSTFSLLGTLSLSGGSGYRYLATAGCHGNKSNQYELRRGSTVIASSAARGGSGDNNAARFFTASGAQTSRATFTLWGRETSSSTLEVFSSIIQVFIAKR